MATENVVSTFSKKQAVILLGIPATIAVAYYLYRRKSTHVKKEKKNGTVPEREADTAVGDTQERTKSILQEAIKYKEKGNESYRNGKYDEAIQYYDKAIEICPEDKKGDLAIFYQNRAASYEMLKRWQQVIADCTKALELNPKYPKPYNRRSKANQQLGNLNECLDDLTASCILESFQNKKAIEEVDLLLRHIAEKEAIELMKHRKPELPSRHFIKTFMDAFVMDPIKSIEITSQEDSPKGFICAKIALDSEVYEDIIPACTEEIDAEESESNYKNEALLLRGTMYTLMGLFEKAEEDLNTLINNAEADPKLRSNALMRRATHRVQTDNKDLAFADYDEAERLDPDNPDIYHNRAQMHILMDQIEMALSDYEIALKLAPDHAIAYVQKCYAEYRLAVMAQDQWRLMSVMNDFKNAVEKYPNCVECYSLMAQVLCDQGQYEEANKFFEKAIETDPQNAALYVHRGVMHLQWKGEVNKAMDIISKENVNPILLLFAYLRRAMITVYMYNDESWVQDCEEANKLDRKNIDVYFTRAELHLKRKQLKKALVFYQRVITIYEGHALARIKKSYVQYRIEALVKNSTPSIEYFKNLKNMHYSYPLCLEGYKIMVQILLEHREYSKAINLIYKAILLDPDDTLLFAQRDFLLLNWHGDTDKALKSFRRYILYERDCFPAYKYMALTFISLGEANRALDILDGAWDSARSFPEVSTLCVLRITASTQKKLMNKFGLDEIDAGLVPWVRPWMVDY